MRILVADQNALLLAAITATFGRHCDLVTASRRDMCLEHAERQQFDVVVAADKLDDYTGLELLSEMGTLFPGTLLVLAASPARLQRLGSRLQMFGLLETIAYPLTPHKLLATLRRARQSLPPKSARSLRHVVLESQWDTGERLGLIERELEKELPPQELPDPATYGDEGLVHGALEVNPRPGAPSAQIGFETEAALDDFVFAPPPTPPQPPPEEYFADIELVPAAVPVAQGVAEEELQGPDPEDSDADDPDAITNDPIFDQPEVPPEPQWAQDGAANDILFESQRPTESATPKANAAAAGRKPTDVTRATDKRPKVRTPTQPTAGQLEAFQRALARRNAERTGQVSAADGGARRGADKAASPQTEGTIHRSSSRSLADLARMAATKRPLLVPKLHLSGAPPRRTVFVVGSGLAAALILGVLFFELLRTPSDATEHLARAPVAQTPFAGGIGPNLATNNSAPVAAPVFIPPPPAAQPVPQDQPPPEIVNIPPAQTSLDPDGIPEPPPPPAVERPGPMEPPSSMEMRGPGFEPQPE